LDVVTPNEQEFASVKDLQLPLCITTLGAKGCCINERIYIPSLPVEAVDTTGAGDTFNGVLAVTLAEGKETEAACRWAVAGAGLSVTKRGVLEAIPHKAEIERMIHNGQ
jgi:ribokinase